MERSLGTLAAATTLLLSLSVSAVEAQTQSAESTAVAPPEFPRGRISGLAFIDYYYNVTGDPRHAYSASGADSGQSFIDGVRPITRDLNGFLIRRVYFQLDNDLSERFATRFRLEVDSRSLGSDGKIGDFVKAAYLQAKSVFTRSDFYIGMVNTPTFENVDDFWGYRSVEKTIADFRGVASSSDIGAALKGHVDANERVGYALLLGNGTGQRPENDRYKRVYFALPLQFGSLRLEPYTDYQVVRSTPEAINLDQATYKVFAGYELKKTAIGAEALTRVNHRGPDPTQEPRGLSVFARHALNEKFAAFARFDHWNPNHRSDDRVDQQFWIGGLDWQPLKDVHVIPNFELLQYKGKGAAVAPEDDDTQVRVTFYYRFSKPQS